MQAERWNRIEQLYEAARAVPLEKRGEFLKQACPDDAELREEVQSLVNQQTDGFLESAPVPAVKTLSAGVKLGNFEIVELIGRGGMGEVYRARDTKLGRDVAIKVLPETLAHDADRLARFNREAKLLASLNHPNIAHVYGVESQALVMELVEGETLAEIIARGPIPVETAIAYAKQIASAFEYAHDKPQPVIHRDLKPANVKVTPDGVVKVLDFGLAKALAGEERAASGSTPTNSPTLTIGPTVPGMVLGTPAYMSPEQAKGEAASRRSDIWSFGVVLYEMVTGKSLFAGDQAAEILAAIVFEEPDLKATPARLRPAIERCLRKDPRKRWYSMEDVRFALDEAPPAEPDVETAPSRTRLYAGLIAAAIFVIGSAAVALIVFRAKPPAAQVLRYSIAAPEGSAVHSFAISPDGRYLAIAAAVNGKRQLWLRPLDALQAQPMPFTEDATFPFWSPDGRYIGFFARTKLKKVAVSGGPSQSLCDAPIGSGGSWSRDDVIVFSPTLVLGSSIQRVSAAGGVPVVIKNQSNLYAQLYPVFLPDGRHFLYLEAGTPERDGIYVGSLDGTENRILTASTLGAVFAPAPSSGGKRLEKLGHILFVRENILMAQPFDAGSARLTGDVFPVADGVLSSTNRYAPATVSDSGVLVYASGSALGGLRQISWYDRTGKLLGPVVSPGPVFYPAISPDAKSVVFERFNNSGSDLWLRDLARGTESRFTSDASLNFAPFWSPRGDRIAFASNRHGALDLFQKAASGSGQDQTLLINGNLKMPTQWSRDGRLVVYVENDPKTKFDLWVLPMEGSEKERKPFPFLQTEFNEFMGQLSPDSHWMAYTSDESGRREVYVRPFPRTEGQWTISAAGGEQPRWRGDGKELFFVAADGKMMAVPVKASAGPKPVFEPGTPVALFDSHLSPTVSSYGGNYDVTADGKRFLIDTFSVSGATSSLTVVVNWNAALRK